jgi:hypothetical protein
MTSLQVMVLAFLYEVMRFSCVPIQNRPNVGICICGLKSVVVPLRNIKKLRRAFTF